jgi:hypothetical protein
MEPTAELKQIIIKALREAAPKKSQAALEHIADTTIAAMKKEDARLAELKKKKLGATVMTPEGSMGKGKPSQL